MTTDRTSAERRAAFQNRVNLLAGMPLPADMQIAADALADLDTKDARLAVALGLLSETRKRSFHLLASMRERDATITRLTAENAALETKITEMWAQHHLGEEENRRLEKEKIALTAENTRLKARNDYLDGLLEKMHVARDSLVTENKRLKNSYRCYSCKQVFEEDDGHGLANEHFGSWLKGDRPKCEDCLRGTATWRGGPHDPFYRVRKEEYDSLHARIAELEAQLAKETEECAKILDRGAVSEVSVVRAICTEYAAAIRSRAPVKQKEGGE